MPGLGHAYWNEYLFGVFVFLVSIIASIMAFLMFVLPVPDSAKLLLVGLPALFYVVSFVDLYRTTLKKKGLRAARQAPLLFLGLGIGYQVFSPSAPLNFYLRNHHVWYRQPDNSLAPVIRKDEFVSGNKLAYRADIAFFERPRLHSLPARGDLVTNSGCEGRFRTAMVIGIGEESIEVSDGRLVVDKEVAEWLPPMGLKLSGNWPATKIQPGSVLVAEFTLGELSRTYEIPLRDVIGRAEPLF